MYFNTSDKSNIILISKIKYFFGLFYSVIFLEDVIAWKFFVNFIMVLLLYIQILLKKLYGLHNLMLRIFNWIKRTKLF